MLTISLIIVGCWSHRASLYLRAQLKQFILFKTMCLTCLVCRSCDSMKERQVKHGFPVPYLHVLIPHPKKVNTLLHFSFSAPHKL